MARRNASGRPPNPFALLEQVQHRDLLRVHRQSSEF